MQLKLIETYSWVCQLFDKNPQWNYIRLSNNNKPSVFTDKEAVTIYFFVVRYLKFSKIKEIHNFAYHFLHDWFPNLTSYQKFNNRLNILYPIFYDITLDIISNNIPENAQQNVQIIDTLPIVTCKGRNRTAKVARDCTDKGFCATKNMYYYGLKLHLLAFRRKRMLPFPNKIYFSRASESDLSVPQELNWFDELIDTELFADKIYIAEEYFKSRQQAIQLDLFTPVKAVKGTPECLKRRDFAANNLFSTAVSKVRQPIEAFFNWLIEKTNIQNASKVRSTNGLCCIVSEN
ncbi:MAG: transposase [Prevotellaceae bacterium]|nr:transposase [Prevotellaceae bacterium]